MRRSLGISDKNGRELFENDVVKTKYGRLCRIVWPKTPSFIGWDLNPLDADFLTLQLHPAPDEYDMWMSKNLEKVD